MNSSRRYTPEDFKTGDRVVYEGHPYDYPTGYKMWRGSHGTVERRSGFTDRVVVRWDDDSPFARQGVGSIGEHYAYLLRPSELAYTPSQEGDTDDDI